MITNGLVFYNDPRNTACYPTYNLLQYSEQFDNAIWGKGQVTVTPNAIIAPDGNLTAYKVVPSTLYATHYLRQNFGQLNIGSVYTCSVYAKAGEYNYLFVEFGDAGLTFYQAAWNLSAGTISYQSNGIASIESAGNGWYKCSLSAIMVNTGTTFVNIDPSITGNNTYSGDGTSGIYIWDAQVTIGSTPRAYQKVTTASTSTYNLVQGVNTLGTLTNYPKFDGNSFNYTSGSSQSISFPTYPAVQLTQSGGSVSAWIRTTGTITGSINGSILANAQTYQNGYWLTQYYSNARIAIYSSVLNTNKQLAGSKVINDGLWHNIVGVWNDGYIWLYVDGILDTSGTHTIQFNAVDTTMYLGKEANPAEGYFTGSQSCHAIYNRALSATEVLQNYNDLKGRFA